MIVGWHGTIPWGTSAEKHPYLYLTLRPKAQVLSGFSQPVPVRYRDITQNGAVPLGAGDCESVQVGGNAASGGGF